MPNTMRLTAKGVTEDDTSAMLSYFACLTKDEHGGCEICEGIFMYDMTCDLQEYIGEEGDELVLDGDVNCQMQPADMAALMRKLLFEECIDLAYMDMDLWDLDERTRCAYSYKSSRKGCTGKLQYSILPAEYWPTDEELRDNKFAVGDALDKHRLTANIPMDYGRCDVGGMLDFFPKIKFKGIGVDKSVVKSYEKDFNA